MSRSLTSWGAAPLPDRTILITDDRNYRHRPKRRHPLANECDGRYARGSLGPCARISPQKSSSSTFSAMPLPQLPKVSLTFHVKALDNPPQRHRRFPWTGTITGLNGSPFNPSDG